MTEIKQLGEKEYKKHLQELGIAKDVINKIWEGILIDRKKEEYKDNKEKKQKLKDK